VVASANIDIERSEVDLYDTTVFRRSAIRTVVMLCGQGEQQGWGTSSGASADSAQICKFAQLTHSILHSGARRISPFIFTYSGTAVPEYLL
jgi:hypothetical protein